MDNEDNVPDTLVVDIKDFIEDGYLEIIDSQKNLKNDLKKVNF